MTIELRHGSGIYKCTCSENGKVYIGQSKDVLLRRCSHISDLRANTHHNSYLQSAYNKYGEESFEWEAVEYCDPEALDDREKYWISYYNSFEDGFNLTDGGSNNRVYKRTAWHKQHLSECAKRRWTAERRASQSAKMSGENNPMFGKTGESNPAYGRCLCGELSPSYGKHHSEESNEKNRQAHLGANNKMSKPVVCEETQVIFDSQGEAGREMYCDSSTINKCCRGVKKSAGGYHWRYATQEEIDSKYN